MNPLREYVSAVAHAVRSKPNGTNIVINRQTAVAAARTIGAAIKKANAPEPKAKRGRRVTKHDVKSVQNRARVRLHRALRLEARE